MPEHLRSSLIVYLSKTCLLKEYPLNEELFFIFMSRIMKDLICEDLHIVLQVPPVMYTMVVLGAGGCWQICKFDARTENHHTHIRLPLNAAQELADASTGEANEAQAKLYRFPSYAYLFTYINTYIWCPASYSTVMLRLGLFTFTNAFVLCF